MPVAFEKCVRDGGKVRTVTLPDNKYRHVCTLNGKSYYGEVKTKKKDASESTATEGVQREGDLTTFSAAAKTDVDKEDRTMVATLTTSDVDRGGTVVLPNGIDLANYRKNPIVLWSHLSILPPIGTNQWIKKAKEGKALIGKTKFAAKPEGYNSSPLWMPDVIMDLYEQGVLKGVSVGLLPRKVHMRFDEKNEGYFKDNKYPKNVWRVVEKAELVEYSCCAIPMNQNALKEAFEDGLEIPDSIANVLGIPQAIADEEDNVIIAPEPEEEYTCFTREELENAPLTIEFVGCKIEEPEPTKVHMTANDVVNAAKALGASNKLAKDIASALKIDDMVKKTIDKEFGKV